jgi:hypothetical protein
MSSGLREGQAGYPLRNDSLTGNTCTAVGFSGPYVAPPRAIGAPCYVVGTQEHKDYLAKQSGTYVSPIVLKCQIDDCERPVCVIDSLAERCYTCMRKICSAHTYFGYGADLEFCHRCHVEVEKLGERMKALDLSRSLPAIIVKK